MSTRQAVAAARPAPAVTRTAAIISHLRRPGTLVLACVAILGVSFTVQAQFDPDFWWHVLVGDRILNGAFPRTDPFTFTAVGHAFIVQEWGSEVLLSVLYRAGMWAVIAFMALVTIAGLVVAMARARRYTSSPAVVAVVLALGLLVGVSTFGPRSQMFTFAFSAVLLAILDRHRRSGGRIIWWCVPLFCLWGNLHGGFTIGLGLFAVVIAVEALEGRFRTRRPATPSRTRVLALVLAASVAAVGLNPNGYGVLVYAGGLLSNPVAQANLDEWRSPNFHDPSFIPLALVIVVLLLVAAKARRVPLTDVVLAAAGVLLTLYAVRDLALLVVTAAPVLVDGCDAWAAELRLLGRSLRPLATPFCAALVAVVTAVSATVIVSRINDPRNDPRSSAYPVAVADALCSTPASNVFIPYGSAGWLLFEMERDAPRPCAFHPVFIWGEVYVIGPHIFQEYLDASAARSDALSILDDEHVQTVWQGTGDPLAAELQRSPGWTCVFDAGGQVIDTRTSLAGEWHTSRSGCP